MTYKITIEATDEVASSKEVEEALGNLNIALSDGLISWTEEEVQD